MFESSYFFYVVGLFLTIFGSVWSLAWWLSGQFTGVRKMVYEQTEKFLAKLEYHERHDDNRFGQIQEALTDIRIRNAASDALLVLREEKQTQQRKSNG